MNALTSAASASATQPPENTIKLNIRDLEQIFNTTDPSPLHENDLNHHVEEFIVTSATEYSLREPIRLVVHLQEYVLNRDSRAVVERAVHNHFRYKADVNRREAGCLGREGRRSLLVGLSFLSLCLVVAEVISGLAIPGTRLLQESLSIAGWVAMWHPMETYLYRWWPLRRAGKIFRKLSTIPVEVQCPDTPAGDVPE